MKLGFIGNGKSTNRYHLPFIDACGLFEVVGFYKQSDRVFEMPYPPYAEMKRFDSVKELCESVDLVVITTPASFHFAIAKECIENNVNVLVEKPFCDTVAQAQELFELARVHNVLISPYQNRRFDSDFLAFKSIIADPSIGEIMEIESNHTHYRPDGANFTGDIYGGAVYGHAVHFIDQIVCVYGEPDDVLYDVCNQKNYTIGDGKQMQPGIPEDYYDIKLIYGNLRIRVRFSQLIVKQPPRWIVNATNATAEKYYIDQQERDLKLGIFPSTADFGKEFDDGIATIYYLDGNEKKIEPDYSGYQQFYNVLYQKLQDHSVKLVEEHEALIVLNILETIVNKEQYKKL